MLSLGSGMVLGREGPTIHMGGNIGKMVADIFKAGKEDAHALIAAGAGGGLTAAFNAPLAGILFVFEEMRPEFKYNFLSVQSVIIASAASDIALRSIMGQSPDIEMTMLAPPRSRLCGYSSYSVSSSAYSASFSTSSSSERSTSSRT